MRDAIDCHLARMEVKLLRLVMLLTIARRLDVVVFLHCECFAVF